jgi:hypothetical protein
MVLLNDETSGELIVDITPGSTPISTTIQQETSKFFPSKMINNDAMQHIRDLRIGKISISTIADKETSTLQDQAPEILIHQVPMLQDQAPEILIHQVPMLQDQAPEILIHQVPMLQDQATSDVSVEQASVPYPIMRGPMDTIDKTKKKKTKTSIYFLISTLVLVFLGNWVVGMMGVDKFTVSIKSINTILKVLVLFLIIYFLLF